MKVMDLQTPPQQPSRNQVNSIPRPTLAVVIGAAVLMIVSGTAGFYFGRRTAPVDVPFFPPPTQTPSPVPNDRGVACTMEAKLCPDGSAVGRVPPDCEFAPCPGDSKLSTNSFCINHLGQPQDEEACRGIPSEARACNADSDCMATCGHGCLSKSWKSTTPLMDCMAMPSYECGCTGNICRQKTADRECGGWDTSGEIVCSCDGTLVKPTCAPGTVCDAGSYTCDGTCGSCCYKGIAENTKYPKCK